MSFRFFQKFTTVFDFQVTLGLISNIIVGVIAYMYQDFVLVNICVFLFILTIISFLLAKLIKADWGVHLMLLTYLFTFLYASTTHLAVLPLLLVYPVIMGLIILFSVNKTIRLIYGMLCLGCALITIYYNQLHIGTEKIYLISSILISLCLLLAFSILSIINSNLLLKYQNTLKKKNLITEAKNKELNKYIDSNLQLENFAHLASHELKTPLGNLSNLTKLLSSKMENKFDAQEREISALIHQEVNRMDQLIADLLSLSNVKNEEIQYSKINGQTFIHSLLSDNFPEQMSNINIKSFPKEFYANFDQMNQLFINLIENGLKFSTLKKEDRRIELSYKDAKDHIQFNVADNGIGIEKTYQENIFLIFKRLHNQNQYKGTGIGLSICKSIVDRHQGKIWVDENNGGGSIFSFTLAKEK